MNSKVFVGSLPYSMRDQDLQDLFASYGTIVSATVIMDRATDRSKGFGFVEFEKPEEAEAAIKALHESEVQGRKIVVSPARPREERPAA